MSQDSDIEWTEKVWNCVRGCTKIGPGCAHCYAETFADRFYGVPGHPYELGFEPRLVPEKLSAPLHWATPTTIFVNSMSDLFHDVVTDDYLKLVAEVMRMASWHTFQVLTKRSERMLDLLTGKLRFAAELPNVWWGVSVENRKHGLPRIEHLRKTPAVTRFLSIEPLLEDLGGINLAGMGWTIVGGESGQGARPMEPEWVRSILTACQVEDVPFFFKQWGMYGPDGVRRSKKANGRELDGRLYDEMPRRKVTKPASLAERRAMIAQIEASWPSGNC